MARFYFAHILHAEISQITEQDKLLIMILIPLNSKM